MSCEVSIYSSSPAITDLELRAALDSRGTAIRLLDAEGYPLQSVPQGSLDGYFIAIGWPSADATTTHDVEAAIRAANKASIDQLGQKGKLGWCQLSIRPFDYESFWKQYPDEADDYEESVAPERLAAIRASQTRYALRSGTRPAQCATLLEQIANALRDATHGVAE